VGKQLLSCMEGGSPPRRLPKVIWLATGRMELPFFLVRRKTNNHLPVLARHSVGNASRCSRCGAGQVRTDGVCSRRSESANKESLIGNSAYSSDMVDGILCVRGLFTFVLYTLATSEKTTRNCRRSNSRRNLKNPIHLSHSPSPSKILLRS
jgi:hypothetical protein